MDPSNKTKKGGIGILFFLKVKCVFAHPLPSLYVYSRINMKYLCPQTQHPPVYIQLSHTRNFVNPG